MCAAEWGRSMKKAYVFLFTIMSLFIFTSAGLAWTEDVEGMIMPSVRGEDNMSDPETVLESIDYVNGAVPLVRICEVQTERNQLKVLFEKSNIFNPDNWASSKTYRRQGNNVC